MAIEIIKKIITETDDEIHITILAKKTTPVKYIDITFAMVPEENETLKTYTEDILPKQIDNLKNKKS